MADYMGTYIKDGEKFRCLGYFLRNSALGELCAHIVRYGDIQQLAEKELSEMELVAERRLRDIDKTLERLTERQAQIADFNNSIDEKVDMLDSLSDSFDEVEREREEWTYAANVVSFLSSLDELSIYIGYEYPDEVGD